MIPRSQRQNLSQNFDLTREYKFDKTFLMNRKPSEGKENTIPKAAQFNIDISKSVDLTQQKPLSPKSLIESCLTFNG